MWVHLPWKHDPDGKELIASCVCEIDSKKCMSSNCALWKNNLNLLLLMRLMMPFFKKIQHSINGKEMKMMVGLKKWRKREMFINFWTCLKLSWENLSTAISLTKGKVRHIIHAKPLLLLSPQILPRFKWTFLNISLVSIKMKCQILTGRQTVLHYTLLWFGSKSIRSWLSYSLTAAFITKQALFHIPSMCLIRFGELLVLT